MGDDAAPLASLPDKYNARMGRAGNLFGEDPIYIDSALGLRDVTKPHITSDSDSQEIASACSFPDMNPHPGCRAYAADFHPTSASAPNCND